MTPAGGVLLREVQGVPIEPHQTPPRNPSVTYWAVLGRASTLTCLLHIGLFGLFELLGVSGLSLINVGLAVVWLGIHALLRHQHNSLALALIWTAICTHVLTAVLYLGWDSGFHYYLLPMVPFLFVNARRTALKLLMTCAVAVGYLTLDVYMRRHPPLHPVDLWVTDLLRYLNVVCTFGYLGYLAHVYFHLVGRVEQSLLALATTDSLTGLANRHRALEIASYEVNRRRRTGSPLCVVVADIDFFKRVNDDHGHETGDRVLVHLAEVLRKSTRQVDTVARWGGEEFLMILPGTGPQAALLLAERARQAVSTAGWPLGLTITMTLGVSCLRNDESFEQAVARADEALYRGKHAGRNCSVLETAAQPPVKPLQPDSSPGSDAHLRPASMNQGLDYPAP